MDNGTTLSTLCQFVSRATVTSALGVGVIENFSMTITLKKVSQHLIFVRETIFQHNIPIYKVRMAS